jgi:hypothetical protein
MNKQELIKEVNEILRDYALVVSRFTDVYQELQNERLDDLEQALTNAGANKWLEYAFGMSLDELWWEARDWELTEDDFKGVN